MRTKIVSILMCLALLSAFVLMSGTSYGATIVVHADKQVTKVADGIPGNITQQACGVVGNATTTIAGAAGSVPGVGSTVANATQTIDATADKALSCSN